MSCLHHLFESEADRHPLSPAIVCGDATLHSMFVWLNEALNGTYETVATPVLTRGALDSDAARHRAQTM